MLTCYIIDDELPAIKSLLNYIEKTPQLNCIGSETRPAAALAWFQENAIYPDILFLDIEMPEINGIELAGLLQNKTHIVLTTGHPGFALDAFELQVSDYLLKPFSYSRFLKCVQKLQGALIDKSIKANESVDSFFIQAEGKGKLIRIFYAEVLYAESQKNYLSIVTRNKKYLTYLTLTEIEERLPDAFIRINKSTIINAEKISHIEGNEIYLADIRENFVLSNTYKESFNNYIKDRVIKTKRY